MSEYTNEFQAEENTNLANSDRVLAYSTEVFTLGLLFMEFCDAIFEVDGTRCLIGMAQAAGSSKELAIVVANSDDEIESHGSNSTVGLSPSLLNIKPQYSTPLKLLDDPHYK
uniref:Uncharacterized protein n=1 Tax=Amphimedon queenslandica TaxID=400682 RepID=A0A1X7TKT2_AMPQE